MNKRMRELLAKIQSKTKEAKGFMDGENKDIDKANAFMNNNITDTEYYILFKEKNDDIIQKRLRTLVTGLANSGLEASQVSNDDLRVILDNFLNGGMTTNFGTVIS